MVRVRKPFEARRCLPKGGTVRQLQKEMIAGLEDRLRGIKPHCNRTGEQVNIKAYAYVGAMRSRVEALAAPEYLDSLDEKVKRRFTDRFPADIPHTTELPRNVLHRIK